MNCKHTYFTPAEEVSNEFSHPVRCDDCNEIVECPHYEIDYADDFNMPTCVDCLAYGSDVVEPMEYDKYEDYLMEV